MNHNEAIVKAAEAVFRNPPADLRNNAWLCLKFVRIVIEKAFDMKPADLYRYYCVDWVQPKGYDVNNGHWARDFERSARKTQQQLHPEEIRVGDLLFKYDAAVLGQKTWAAWFPGQPYQPGTWVGHVAIYLGNGVIIENANPAWRQKGFLQANGCIVKSRYDTSPAWTSRIRFDPNRRAA